jgi:hypothetical protein
LGIGGNGGEKREGAALLSTEYEFNRLSQVMNSFGAGPGARLDRLPLAKDNIDTVYQNSILISIGASGPDR